QDGDLPFRVVLLHEGVHDLQAAHHLSGWEAEHGVDQIDRQQRMVLVAADPFEDVIHLRIDVAGHVASRIVLSLRCRSKPTWRQDPYLSTPRWPPAAAAAGGRCRRRTPRRPRPASRSTWGARA